MWGKGFVVGLVVALCALPADQVRAGDLTGKLNRENRFATWHGIEPDKWATLWLIKRHVSPQAYFLLFPPNSELPDDVTPFGVPGADIRRQSRVSMFRRLMKQLQLDGPGVRYVDAIVQDVEVNIWDAPSHPHSAWFEPVFRQLQARYGRDQVPVDCYLALFDGLATLAGQNGIDLEQFHRALDVSSQCPGLKNSGRKPFVAAMNQREILRQISLGRKVVFVDTREDEEYNEVHLPGAHVLRLRDVTPNAVARFADADLVVPYCVKDFRGFEVAKAMKQQGFARVATLSPSGLKGWIAAGLPVARPGHTNDRDAQAALRRCAVEPNRCLEGES